MLHAPILSWLVCEYSTSFKFRFGLFHRSCFPGKKAAGDHPGPAARGSLALPKTPRPRASRQWTQPRRLVCGMVRHGTWQSRRPGCRSLSGTSLRLGEAT